MTSDALKALSWRFDDELFNKGNLQVVDELIAPNFVNHDAAQEAVGGGIAEFLSAIRAAFTDLAFTNEALIAEGDTVAHRVRISGTHTGEYLGVPPTGKQITIRSHDFQRWEDGRMVERWSIVDTIGLMRQLGIKEKGFEDESSN